MEQFYVQRHDFYVYLKCHVLVLFGTLDNFLFKVLLLFNWRKKDVFLMYACIVFGVKECFFFYFINLESM